MVLIFVPIIAMSTLGEPAFDATREEAAAFFRNTAESSWADAAGTVALLGLVALTLFIVGLCLLLRRAEGEPPWRSTVALVFGALFAAYLFTDASWEAAGNRGADLDPGLAHFAFDMGNIGFANAWVSMGSFAAFSGWAVLKTGVFRRWLGWLMVASGVGLVLSRFVWTTNAWLVPYALFWIWVIAVSIRLLRKPADNRGRPGHELYLACSRCAWHACHVQRERPTQRGMLTGQSRVEQPQGRTSDDSELNARRRSERIRSTTTLARTPTTVAAPPPISAHRGPALSATQPRIGEPIAVPPNSTMM